MFFRPNKALLLAGTKLKNTYKSLELTTATLLPTVIHHTPSSITSYKDCDQTSTTTQHSINQPSESVNLTSSELISVLRRHVKKPVDTTSLIHDYLLFGYDNNRLNTHAIVEITQNQTVLQLRVMSRH